MYYEFTSRIKVTYHINAAEMSHCNVQIQLIKRILNQIALDCRSCAC